MIRISSVNRFNRRIGIIREMTLRRERVSDLEKVEVLACIISHGGGELKTSHFSDGSTVTRDGLEFACIINGIELPQNKTKENLLGALLRHVGKSMIPRDVIHPGSTVQADALERVYLGLLRMEES